MDALRGSRTTIRLGIIAISLCVDAFAGAGTAIGHRGVPISFGLDALPDARPTILRRLPSVGGRVSAGKVRTVQGVVRDRCIRPRLGARCRHITLCSSLIPLDGGLVALVRSAVTLRCGLVSLIGHLISLIGDLVTVLARLVTVLAGLITLFARLITLLAGLIALLAGRITLLARLIALIAGRITRFAGLVAVFVGMVPLASA